MIASELREQIERIVGAEHLSTGRADAEVYSYDASLAVAAEHQLDHGNVLHPLRASELNPPTIKWFVAESPMGMTPT